MNILPGPPSGQASSDVTPTRGSPERFDQLAALLDELDLDRIWDEATETEQRVLLDELVQEVPVHDDHLEVAVHGAPRLNVLLSEVGLAAPEKISGVGGPT